MSLAQFMKKTCVALAVSCVSVAGFAAGNQALSAFTPKQQAQITDYVNQAVPSIVMAHPSIVVQAIKKFQAQQQQMRVQGAKHVIAAKINTLLRYPYTPTVNQKGKVTLVEFFDYQCSYCHMAFPMINALAKANPDMRIVYKDLPIFGPASIYAAKGSIAAYKQSPAKYVQYHDALFKSGLMEGKLTNAAVDKIAQKVGLNMTQFHKVINSSVASAAIKSNMALASALHLTGTPALVVVPSKATTQVPLKNIVFVPGMMQQPALQQALAKIRQVS